MREIKEIQFFFLKHVNYMQIGLFCNILCLCYELVCYKT